MTGSRARGNRGVGSFGALLQAGVGPLQGLLRRSSRGCHRASRRRGPAKDSTARRSLARHSGANRLILPGSIRAWVDRMAGRRARPSVAGRAGRSPAGRAPSFDTPFRRRSIIAGTSTRPALSSARRVRVPLGGRERSSPRSDGEDRAQPR